MTDDDDQWLAALRDQPEPGTRPRTLAEANTLRGVIQHTRDNPAAVDGLDPDGAWRRIEHAAVDEGLLPRGEMTHGLQPADERNAGKPRGNGRFWAGASALAAAVAAALYLGSGPLLLGTRGAELLPPMRSQDPQAEATALRTELIAAGATVGAVEVDVSSGATRLSVDLGRPPRPGDEFDSVLSRYRVPEVSGARFTIQIIPTPPP